ncbi:hypothetical protein ASPCADRAFT_396895 [Aspergillus carbonarius ITEM 5010]|uniref:alcohol dehydrogenase (NADP(+)) n=1 Tax=Aspergillus carbonarius (strain ITEM 5010) TaxID=602072 RepID=A0A1R3RKY6_ASPC5|nr:hypothetical protein ASPCADRAFT_396895 [Aspergillus carbonarius ITEM 5010]
MEQSYKFEGWLGHNPDSAHGKMEWGFFDPKVWEEDDVDIRITHCGVCGSDIHTLKSGWGETHYPCCVGHEIIGTVVRTGKNVQKFEPGDRRFVVKIPPGLSSENAAPMLCAGITVFSPLKKHGCGPGQKVGVVGVGGLGHFAVLFAKAMGAEEVVGISQAANKEREVLALGATRYIASSDDKCWVERTARTLDLIICTVSSSKFPLNDYIKLLKVGGTFVQVGAPDNGELPNVNALTLIFNNVNRCASAAGSPHDIEEMLQFAADHKVKPWVQTRPMSEANQVIQDIEAGKARYRYVLVNEKHVETSQA